MGKPQDSFLRAFEAAFKARASVEAAWAGGQVASNTAALPVDQRVRRPGQVRQRESFELADLAASVGGWRVVVEFESREVPLSNLLKYWPYIRGELATKPDQPVLICHFSDWWSYATRRDLWNWTMTQMKKDPDRLVQIEGRQFDHWGKNESLRAESIAQAIDWILLATSAPPEATRHLGS